MKKVFLTLVLAASVVFASNAQNPVHHTQDGFQIQTQTNFIIVQDWILGF